MREYLHNKGCLGESRENHPHKRDEKQTGKKHGSDIVERVDFLK
jgi:hypothetical protein